ncbi:MAG: anthranilate phosphoribosyltransferase [Gammaproteobacteria bacterium]
MDIQNAIQQIVEHNDLTEKDMESVMRQIMQGECTPAQIGGLLTGLRMKGETVEEITAAATVMREFALGVDIDADYLVDVVGTGGDGSHTFNVSTTAAFVVAAAGGHVAKHHNRSASSLSGSADVLEKAGVRVGLAPEQVIECIKKTGIGFMFAPAHHSAMKHVAPVRRELGTRTLFNMLGPLTNPARPPNALVGVYIMDIVEPLTEVMRKLGADHVLIVHSHDGMDEISICDRTRVAELKDGSIKSYDISPEEFGLARHDRSEITVNGVDESLSLMQSVLDNKAGAARDIVVFNAGAAIYAAGLAPDLQTGVDTAGRVIADGSAKQKLADLIELTGSFA